LVAVIAGVSVTGDVAVVVAVVAESA